MTLQSSGTITLAQIAAEFGGSTPHSLSEYYRGGSFVPSSVTQVPASGTIDFADFYGTSAAITAAVTSSTTNRNVSTIFGSNFTANIAKILIINSGVEVGASSLSNYAINVPSGMGGTLTIQNAGTLSGAGGDGGTSSGEDGDDGGTAIYIASNNVTVTNTGTIRGGGGGGGRGANGNAGTTQSQSIFLCQGGSAGTGGAGGNGQGYDQSQSNGSGGTGGGSRTAYLSYDIGAGPGAGPSQFQCDSWNVYTNGTGGSSGGNGGSYGTAGSNGGGSGSSQGNGGAAGRYIQLASGISYSLSNSGTLQGTAP